MVITLVMQQGDETRYRVSVLVFGTVGSNKTGSEQDGGLM